MELTRSQKAALALDKNISVNAGAGSGKTRILVERFLHIVLNDPSLTRRVAAITFTEKAAGEMQERIAETVNARLQEAEISAEKRRSLQRIRDQLKSAYISTIHGFCNRLLSEFPLQAGVTPDFGVLDAIRQDVLIHSAIQQLFREIDKEEGNEELFELFINLPRARIRQMLETGLKQPWEMRQVARRFEAWDEESFMAYLQKEWDDWFSSFAGEDDMREAQKQASAILQENRVAAKRDKGVETRLALEAMVDCDDFSGAQAQTAFLELCDRFTKNDGGSYANLAQLGGNPSWSTSARPLLKELSAFAAKFGPHISRDKMGLPPNEEDRRFFRLFNIYLGLQKRCDEAYADLKKEMGVLDFEDLQIKTLELLKNNEAIRRELSARFRYLMVDEFQDTNELQWQIVELLAGGKDNFAGDKVFVVGDPKQSIYGFRNADVRVFRKVMDFFARRDGKILGYEGNITFAESFRFVPRLNSFINHVFTTVLRKDPENHYSVGYDSLKAQRLADVQSDAELALLPQDDPSLNQASYIAARIRRLFDAHTQISQPGADGEKERDIRYGDVAILLRERGNLNDVERALREQDIPFKTVGGIGFWQRQEIYDFYHALRFLANPADDLALVALLRSRLFLLPDNLLFELAHFKDKSYWQRLKAFSEKADAAAEIHNALEKLQRWLLLRERLDLSRLLSAIMDETALSALLYAEFSGDQRAANLQKVLELAASLEQSGPGGLGALLETIDSLINRDVSEGEAFLALDDQHSVKIMTIHTSKGLQFPVVFVPYLEKKMRGPGGEVILEPDIGMAFTLKPEDEKNDTKNDNVLLRLAKRRRQQKEEAEARRVFYVALTRASDHLFLSAEIKDKLPENSPLAWFTESCAGLGFTGTQAGVFSGDGFRLRVVDSYEASGQSTSQDDSFKTVLKTLRAEVDSLPKTAPAPRQQTVEVSGRVFSATALMTFLEDPDKYYERYHLGFFKDDYLRFSEAADDSREIDSLQKGKIVHRFLELQARGDAGPEELTERVLFEHEIFDHALQEALKEELNELHSGMQQSPHGRTILEATDFRSEIAVTMRIGDDFFTGTLDRLQKNKDGLWEVIDYKTNRIEAGQVEAEGKKYDVQMQAYALLLSKLYPGQPVYEVTLFFLQPDKTFAQSYTPAQLAGVEKHFADTVKEIKTRYPVEPFGAGRRS